MTTTQTDDEHLRQYEREMEERWRDLMDAESAKVSTRELEHIYGAYLDVLDRYMDRFRVVQHERELAAM